MKKIFSSKLFLCILTAVICISGAVLADSLLNANDILYAPSNSNFNVSNVKDALDELYNKPKGSEVFAVAQYGNSWLSGYLIDLSTGTFTGAINEHVVGRTMSVEWTGNSYVVKALVSGKFLKSWNYDFEIIDCNAGDTIVTFNRLGSGTTVFNTVGMIE